MDYPFKRIFLDLQQTLGDTPHGATSTFEVASHQESGLRSRLAARQFAWAADAPTPLGGADSAPNPAEYVLAALAACQEATYRYYADALEVPLDSVSVRAEGDIDLRGMFAVDPAIRPGFGDIVATVQVTSSAPETDLRRLKAAVDRHCPMVDILRNATPVHLDLEIVGNDRDDSAAA